MTPEEQAAIQGLLERGQLSPEALSAARREWAARIQAGEQASLLGVIQARYFSGAPATLGYPSHAGPGSSDFPRADSSRFPQAGSSDFPQASSSRFPQAGSHFPQAHTTPGSRPPGAPTQETRAEAAAPGASGERTKRIGPYVLEEELARGGMGVVFRGRHERLGRKVAIKLLMGGAGSSARARERFRLEAQATARLRHPNVVAIHDVGESEDGTPYLAMDLIEGESLADRLEREGKLRPREAATLVEKIARAVAYAHQERILHRDLKPDNVLLEGKTGEPLLTDFGLAKLVDEEEGEGITRTGQMMGTPHYAAPEQLSGQPTDARSDVYALGGTLYALLVGSPPFEAETVLELAARVARDDPPRPTSRVADLDRDLETICLKCLEKSPDDRYGSALALADDLARYAANEAILASPPSLGERAKKWTRRNRSLALGIGTAVAILLGALLGAIGWVARQEAAAEAARVASAREGAERAWAALASAKDEEGRTNRALEALRAAGRWDTLSSAPEARAAHLRAALALGDEALASEQWSLAKYAFGQALGLGDDATVEERLAAVDAAQTAEARARRKRVQTWLREIKTGEAQNWLSGLADAVYGILTDPGPETSEVVIAELNQISGEMETLERKIVELRAGDIVGVPELLAWRRGGGPPPKEIGQAAGTVAIRLGEHPKQNFAAEEAYGEAARGAIAGYQESGLEPGRFQQARVCVEVLGRLPRTPAASLALRRYLRAELDDARAYEAALALMRWGDPESLEAVYTARKSMGLSSTFSSLVSKHLQRFGAPDADAEKSNDPMVLFDLGLKQIAHRRYTEAERTFTRVIALDPKRAPAFSNRALTRRRLGRPQEAILDYDTALQLTPGAPEILARRGLVYCTLNRMDLALRDLSEALELAPTLEEALYNRALVHFMTRRYDLALRDYESLVSQHPRSAIYLRHYCDTLVHLRRFDDAQKVYDKLVELDPHDHESAALRAFFLAENDRVAEAERELSRILDADPKCGVALAVRGELHSRRGQVAQARSCLNRARAANPKSRKIRFLCANFFYGQNELEVALGDATALCEQEGENPTNRALKGQILWKLRRVEEAFKEWDLALRSLPTAAETLFYRGLALENLGRPEAAIQDYQRFLKHHGQTPFARRIRKRLAALQGAQPSPR